MLGKFWFVRSTLLFSVEQQSQTMESLSVFNTESGCLESGMLHGSCVSRSPQDKAERIHIYVLMALVWLAGFIYKLALKIPTSYVENGKCIHMRRWPSKAAQ